MKKLWDDVAAILKAPFVGELDLIQLFLLVGAVLIFATAWALVLSHVRYAEMNVAEAI